MVHRTVFFLKMNGRELKKDNLLPEDISFENIAAQIPGFSGDDIRNLVNEARFFAMRRWSEEGYSGIKQMKVTISDFEQAIDKVAFGPEKKSHIMSPEEKDRVAKHEVGHALVGYMLEGESTDTIHKISIVQRTL